ncbi:SDR family NAD(P)-dependent oxidoreductase [Sneathiella aquimaris]|uniref:SDR family NAD(P)-dependent oxidoreductase n=1 Tax=Sneathiella aquimaris TaxID=2599305 RepID=UPI00146B4775|nr:SDR family NAD(P)-dependent oxidoreductase [Sneathiella aquimaris]
MNSNKPVWIIGASSGIGAELARQYAAEGTPVIISARRKEQLDKVASEFPDLLTTCPMDVTDPDTIQKCVTALFSSEKPPEQVIINAGTYRPMTSDKFVAQNGIDTMTVNYFGVIRVLEQILPPLLKADAGKIVVMGSVAGFNGLPLSHAYGPSKAALINLCEGLAVDLAKTGVDLQIINPGFVRTPLTDQNKHPMPFLLEVDDAARRIREGIETNRFEITFPLRFAYMLKLIRLLPYWISMPLIRKVTGS